MSSGHDAEIPAQTKTETKNKPTSSRNDALGRAVENATTATIRSIHPLDAMTAVVVGLRPDWRPETVRAALARDRRPWRDVALAAVRAATDPDVRTPGAIENHDARQYAPTPVPPTVAYLRTVPRCQHGAESGCCALCRNGVES
jgi:hypothetical protein